MKNLHFAKKINGTEETGIIDVSVNPPELICICTEEKAEMIMQWYDKMAISINAFKVIKNWSDEQDDEWDDQGYFADHILKKIQAT